MVTEGVSTAAPNESSRRMGPRFSRGRRPAERWSLGELNSTIASLIGMTARLDRMASSLQERLTTSIRGISLRQIRLVCGVVLFGYLVSHFLNHALGNISMEALAAGVYYHVLFWRFPPVAIVFYGAALAHTGLGIWALYKRREFGGKPMEPLQLVLGLSIPVLIIS